MWKLELAVVECVCHVSNGNNPSILAFLLIFINIYIQNTHGKISNPLIIWHKTIQGELLYQVIFLQNKSKVIYRFVPCFWIFQVLLKLHTVGAKLAKPGHPSNTISQVWWQFPPFVMHFLPNKSFLPEYCYLSILGQASSWLISRRLTWIFRSQFESGD